LDLQSLEKSGIAEGFELHKLLSPSIKSLFSGSHHSNEEEETTKRKSSWFSSLSSEKIHQNESSPSKLGSIFRSKTTSSLTLKKPQKSSLQKKWELPLLSPPIESSTTSNTTQSTSTPEEIPSTPSSPESPDPQRSSSTVESDENQSKPIFVTTSNIGDILEQFDKKHKRT